MKNRLSQFIFIFLAFILFSCSESQDNFTVIQTTSPFDFHAIASYQGKLYATGGDVWTKSNLLISEDGINWSMDSLTNKSIFDLYSTDSSLYGVGNDGYIFSGSPTLTLSRTKFWGLLRAFTSIGNTFVAVGGKDFNKGWIYQVNANLVVDTAHQFQHEISAVSCSEKGVCIACGYGIILKSTDAGKNWERIDETGDYYNSIAEDGDGNFYIVGYSGTILKSTNDGNIWNKLKNGHSPLANNKPFRTIKFIQETGIITGDKGLIWISKNNGLNWEDNSIDTDLDIFDFEIIQDKLICVSEQGQMIMVNL